MRQIVVGLDESDGAAEALRWAVAEGRCRGWSVTAVLAWSYLDQHRGSPTEDFDPSYRQADAEAALDIIVERAVAADAGSVERLAICDLAPRALLEASQGAELLVLGARGLGGFRGLLLGSVSQQCLHHATCPVAIVRTIGAASVPQRIVVGVDGSSTSQRALHWALDEARCRQAVVTVAYAWRPAVLAGFEYAAPALEPSALEAEAQRILDTAVDAADATGLPAPVERVLAIGSPAGVLLDSAVGASLVVMGSRGRGGFSGLLLGSASQQVTHHAPCPVVVVPHVAEP